MTDEDEERAAARRRQGVTGLAALSALVLLLIAIVVVAMPRGDQAERAEAGASSASGAAGEPEAPYATSAAGRRAGPGGRHARLPRLGGAAAELAVLTSATSAMVDAAVDRQAIAGKLDVRHCGEACDLVRSTLGAPDEVTIAVQTSSDYILPPRESLDVVGRTLTETERALVHTRSLAVVVGVRGARDPNQVPARAAFAITAVLAETLGGFVYDETTRTIENALTFAERAITVKRGDDVFSPRHIVVQTYRQDDGTARLITLGMSRFGSPDFTMRGADMSLTGPLANLLNAVASRAAAAAETLEPITLEDVAKATRRPLTQLTHDAVRSSPITLDVVDTDRVDGDPDNLVVELLPEGGATEDAWRKTVLTLYGEAPAVVLTAFDDELEAIATRARAELPAAIARLEAGEGSLFVKAPFPILAPPVAGARGQEEWMWVDVHGCDARTCRGTLTNAPGYATNLTAGARVTIERSRAADWLLRRPNGDVVGGASIELLERRALAPAPSSAVTPPGSAAPR